MPRTSFDARFFYESDLSIRPLQVSNLGPFLFLFLIPKQGLRDLLNVIKHFLLNRILVLLAPVL